jgi:hypothetical protein
VGSRAAGGGFVVGVEQVALVDREAAAPDARGQAVAEGLQRFDAPVEVVSPLVREALPVLAARRAPRGEAIERCADLGERDSGGAAGLDEGDPAQDGAVVASLVAVGAGRRDQALALVEAERGGADAAPRGDLAYRKLRSHLT